MSKQLDRLNDYINALPPGGLCIAFSGGVDSAVLLKAACSLRGTVHAVTAYTLFHTPAEPGEAEDLARACGADFHLLTPDLPDTVLQNPTDRCYLCKHALFAGLRRHADDHNLPHLLDGTNADDLKQYRPGLKALKELGVRSPLADLGFAKATVRRLAAELGLSVANKPSAPCLATRYPYNQPIDGDKLAAVDQIEALVRGFGIVIVRARVEGPTLRLEVPTADFPALLQHREAVVDAAINAGFAGISLDLEGFRSGSMDIRARRMGLLDPA